MALLWVCWILKSMDWMPLGILNFSQFFSYICLFCVVFLLGNRLSCSPDSLELFVCLRMALHLWPPFLELSSAGMPGMCQHTGLAHTLNFPYSGWGLNVVPCALSYNCICECYVNGQFFFLEVKCSLIGPYGERSNEVQGPALSFWWHFVMFLQKG